MWFDADTTEGAGTAFGPFTFNSLHLATIPLPKAIDNDLSDPINRFHFHMFCLSHTRRGMDIFRTVKKLKGQPQDHWNESTAYGCVILCARAIPITMMEFGVTMYAYLNWDINSLPTMRENGRWKKA